MAQRDCGHLGHSREPPAGMAFGCETAATKNRKAASAAYKAAPLQSAGLWIAFRRFSSVPFEFRSFVVVRIELGGQRELMGIPGGRLLAWLSAVKPQPRKVVKQRRQPTKRLPSGTRWVLESPTDCFVGGV
jgi:hypothetical protein